MGRVSLTVVLLVIFIGFNVFSQEKKIETKEDNPNITEQKIESIAESVENESTDYTNLIDELLYYQEHPLDLNNCTREDLINLGLLNEIQISNLLNHIEQNGKLIVLYELQAIDGFDKSSIDKILPYVKVEDTFKQSQASWSEMWKYGTNQVVTRYTRILEQQEGYKTYTDSLINASPNSRYLGSADRLYFRYRFNYGNNISFGFTGEKDAGEVMFNSKKVYDERIANNPKIDTASKIKLRENLKPGFDFYSFHFYMRNLWKFKQVALGDYQVLFGQGLTFGKGLAFGKTVDPLSIKRNYNGLKPYTSVNEGLYLRGAAIDYAITKKIDVTVFGSNKNVDANVNVDTSQGGLDAAAFEGISVSSVQISGFHRTPTELADKKAINERVLGANLCYNTRKLRLGATAVHSEYSAPFIPSSGISNMYDFSGTKNLNLGLDYNCLFKNFNFFGEFGRSANGGLAMISGVMMSLDPRFIMMVHFRNYAKDYQALAANAIGENVTIANEKGLYMGAQFKPNYLWTLSGYYDYFVFPWLKSQVTSPGTNGFDFFSQVNYTPTRKINLYARYRNRSKAKNTSESIDDIDYLIAVNQQNYRFEANYPVSKSVSFKNRIEAIDYAPTEGKKERGYLFFTDLSYKALSSPVQLVLRYALFDTDGFNSKIYAFEKEVLYGYSLPAYYYKGSRVMGLVRYTVKRNIDVWLRVGAFIYDNKTTNGSGLSAVDKNHRTELKVQVRYKF